jgi:hypothetical protein
MDVIRITIRNQKNIPVAKADFTSERAAVSLFAVSFSGGDKAMIKKEKMSATNNRGSRETVSMVGPIGVIQSCSAQLTRKMMEKKNKSRCHGSVLENVEKMNVSKSEMKNAEEII